MSWRPGVAPLLVEHGGARSELLPACPVLRLQCVAFRTDAPGNSTHSTAHSLASALVCGRGSVRPLPMATPTRSKLGSGTDDKLSGLVWRGTQQDASRPCCCCCCRCCSGNISCCRGCLPPRTYVQTACKRCHALLLLLVTDKRPAVSLLCVCLACWLRLRLQWRLCCTSPFSTWRM